MVEGWLVGGWGGCIRWIPPLVYVCPSMRVCVPPVGTNVSFEQFADSPLSSWPARIQSLAPSSGLLALALSSRGYQCATQMPPANSLMHHRRIWGCLWIAQCTGHSFVLRHDGKLCTVNCLRRGGKRRRLCLVLRRDFRRSRVAVLARTT